MTSAINALPIDETFPVAGIDNPSQGFRDNFNYIKTGLGVAAEEITDLQNNTAKVNVDTDFNGVRLENAEINTFYGTVYNYSTLTTNTNINIRNGAYQIAVVDGDITLTFTNWPATDLHGKIILHLTAVNATREVTFNSLSGVLKYSNSFSILGNAVTADSIDLAENIDYIIEVWSVDNGDTIFLNYLGEFAE